MCVLDINMGRWSGCGSVNVGLVICVVTYDDVGVRQTRTCGYVNSCKCDDSVSMCVCKCA